MKPSSTPAFNPAELPGELRSRGRPLSVHRPWKVVVAEAQARLAARLFGDKWKSFGRGAGFKSALVFGFAAFAFVAALVLAWVYFYRPPQNEDPIFVLAAAGFFLLFGVVLVIAALYERLSLNEPPAEATIADSPTSVPDMYLVYSDGLAAVKDGDSEFLAWNEVREVAFVWRKMEYQTVIRGGDDREMIVWSGFSEMGELQLAIAQQVNKCLLPKVLKRIADGKAVKFGALTLSRSGLKYKDRRANWDDITSLKIDVHGGDRRFIVWTRGSLLRWCWCEVHNISNWDTFYDALCRTAPDHLLQKSSRPRW
jgi:hypothetical protein